MEIGAFSLEEINNVVANAIKKNFNLHVDVKMVPKGILPRHGYFACNKNLDYRGKKIIIEDDQSSKFSCIDDSSKFSFAGV